MIHGCNYGKDTYSDKIKDVYIRRRICGDKIICGLNEKQHTLIGMNIKRRSRL